MTRLTELPQRGVIAVEGNDRVEFLQGLVSNDVTAVAPNRAVWAALLTPQGKWLADFFVLADGERLLLDVERAQMPMLTQRLTRFRLRAKVQVRPADSWRVYAAWDGAPTCDGIVAPDPRLPDAGWRVLSAGSLPVTATPADWDAHRLGLGLPDGSRDLEADKSVLLEAGVDELLGVSWTKGCYMGQELTARTKYRGLLKRPCPRPARRCCAMGPRSARCGRALPIRVSPCCAWRSCMGRCCTVARPAWCRIRQPGCICRRP